MNIPDLARVRHGHLSIQNSNLWKTLAIRRRTFFHPVIGVENFMQKKHGIMPNSFSCDKNPANYDSILKAGADI